jgi:hypothetical protein
MSEACPLQGCPIIQLLNDPDELKAKLSEKSRYVRGIQGILFFRLIPQLAVLFVLVNLLFLFIGYFNLGFLSVAVLFLLLATIGKIIMEKFGKLIIDFFFPEEFNAGTPEESNRVRSIDEVANFLGNLPIAKGCPVQRAPPMKRIILFSVLFIVFYITTTFWFNFVVFNLLLILPGVLLHPAVNPHIVKILGSIFPQKAKIE